MTKIDTTYETFVNQLKQSDLESRDREACISLLRLIDLIKADKTLHIEPEDLILDLLSHDFTEDEVFTIEDTYSI